MQNESPELEAEKKDETCEENEDGEEKKDEEKILEDSSEKPLVVSSVICRVYWLVIGRSLTCGRK